MQTKLIEFKNQDNETLRGILTIPDEKPKAGAIFLQGFERNATVEKKFRQIADALVGREIASLRFDASGCGLSDGDFSKTTIKKRAQELLKALEVLQKEAGILKINFVAHSLGTCPLALELEGLDKIINKMVFIAPALNQKDLLRFYFARDSMKKINPDIKISWVNYKQHLNEEEFLADCLHAGKMVRENYINPDYFIETKDLDFSHSFDSMIGKILHVHGEFDLSVPLESLNVEFPNRIIVPGGDHNLERPDFWQQWFTRAVEFLAK
jgi:pimeloyl-ACP methyl ester carboxylesterase